MPAPKLIALDTSTEACSVALAVGEEKLERYKVLRRGHAEFILEMVDQVLAEAGLALTALDGLSFCRGPGSFTGVRIGVGVAQGLAFGADLPVVPVSTLAALAQGVHREHGAERILAAIDARMSEVYWAAYTVDREGLVVPQTEEAVAAPERVRLPDAEPWIGAGTGWGAQREALAVGCAVRECYPEQLPRALDCLPLAARMHARGEMLPAEEALPIYLRDRVTR